MMTTPESYTMESEIYEVTNGRINITLPPNCAVILKNIGRETETTD